MKKYDKYKDSGIEWLGEIPEHWSVEKLKYVCEITDGTHYSPQIVSEGMPYITVANVSKNYIDVENANKISNEDYLKLVKQGCQPQKGDVLLAKDGTVGRSAIVDNNQYVVLSSLGILHPQEKITSKFLKYSLDSNYLQEQMQEAMAGAALRRITITKICEFVILRPNIEEQAIIASYLDDKVSKIDAAIAEKESMIEDLQNYRKSVITEAVTHGLTPDVPMKDSGVEWIGMIPENWEVLKSSYIFKMIGSGTTPNTNNELYYNSNGINWLQTGDLNDGEITETSKHITKKAIEECSALREYPINSIVIAMYGATIGKVGILKINTTTNQACCVLSDSDIMDHKYAYYSFLASKDSLINMASGGGQPNISQAIIRNHRLVVPSLKEQEEIINFLDSKMEFLSLSISEIQSQIEDLKNYKSSVITEAVTGKIDLR